MGGSLDSVIRGYQNRQVAAREKAVADAKKENPDIAPEQIVAIEADYPDLSREDAMDEIAADYTKKFIADTEAFREFISMSKEHRKLGKWLIDNLKAVIVKIKANFSSQKARDAASREAFGKDLEPVEKALKLWEEAYAEGQKVVKNAPVRENTGEGVAKRSLNIAYTNGNVVMLADARNLTSEQAVEYLKEAKAGKIKRTAYIPIRKDTPQVVIDTMVQVNETVANRSFVMQVQKAQQAMSEGYNRKKQYSGKRGHALSPEQIVDIIEKLEDPDFAIYQTERTDDNGNELPNNVVFFVTFGENDSEGLAVIEFDSFIDPQYIGTEFGDTQFHTVVTVFAPDTEIDGVPFDYAEFLLENHNNFYLEIVRKQPEGSATAEIVPNTSNELLSSKRIAQPDPKVKNSVAGTEDILAEAEEQAAAKQATQARLNYLRKQVAIIKYKTADPKSVDKIAGRLVRQ